jgi:hypothetical protein
MQDHTGTHIATSKGEAEFLQEITPDHRTYTEIDIDGYITYQCDDCGAIHDEEKCDCK